ncbi:MAG TPA: hypothetical protein V6D19_14185 [Stenomitos sp.]
MDAPTEFERALAEFNAERYDEALRILLPLLDAEMPAALGLAGSIYQLGLGVHPDGPKAVRLLSRAAELGDGLAAHNLGTLYYVGLPGVDRNPTLSRSWYLKARALGTKFVSDEFHD